MQISSILAQNTSKTILQKSTILEMNEINLCIKINTFVHVPQLSLENGFSVLCRHY